MDDFICELCADATDMGWALDDDACKALTAYVARARDDWDSGGTRRSQVQRHARLILVHAVLAAKTAGTPDVKCEQIRLAIAELAAQEA